MEAADMLPVADSSAACEAEQCRCFMRLQCSDVQGEKRKSTMIPADLYSGFNHFCPFLSSHQIFSHVTMTSPRAASTAVLPDSLDETL